MNYFFIFCKFFFANNQNCEINYLVKAENKEKFVNCEKSEEIIALNEKNWKFIYISKIDSENYFKIKINENPKNIAKINNFLEKIEEKKSFYTKNTKWYEIYNYLISELKILQIKNK